jgi:hypothetical protein
MQKIYMCDIFKFQEWSSLLVKRRFTTSTVIQDRKVTEVDTLIQILIVRDRIQLRKNISIDM